MSVEASLLEMGFDPDQVRRVLKRTLVIETALAYLTSGLLVVLPARL